MKQSNKEKQQMDERMGWRGSHRHQEAWLRISQEIQMGNYRDRQEEIRATFEKAWAAGVAYREANAELYSSDLLLGAARFRGDAYEDGYRRGFIDGKNNQTR
jgi:hypothetical protein